MTLLSSIKLFGWVGDRFKHQVAMFAVMAIMAVQGVANMQAQWAIIGEFSNMPQEELLDWIQENTPPDSVFSGAMPTMASVKLSTGWLIWTGESNFFHHAAFASAVPPGRPPETLYFDLCHAVRSSRRTGFLYRILIELCGFSSCKHKQLAGLRSLDTSSLLRCSDTSPGCGEFADPGCYCDGLLLALRAAPQYFSTDPASTSPDWTATPTPSAHLGS
ncbi:hypothetical protein NQZ68_026138 [Dissostichus eleginoides]|nr:hypothetical protein NQZ68_026138 [Dissostichus eleginoides]